MFAYRRYLRWGRPRFAHVITWRLHVFKRAIVIQGGATMWPLAACQQKSPQEQYKDTPDDQIDAAIVFVDSNYPPDSTTAVVDDVTKMVLSGAHVAPTWARLWSH